MSSYIRDFSNFTTVGEGRTPKGSTCPVAGCYQISAPQRRDKVINWRGLSETPRISLRALREHSSQLVFKNKAQAVRLLMRARDFSRTEANWQVQELRATGLVSVERWKEEPQPSLFEASISETALHEAGAAVPEMTP
jgi:hypothetical protein